MNDSPVGTIPYRASTPFTNDLIMRTTVYLAIVLLCGALLSVSCSAQCINCGVRVRAVAPAVTITAPVSAPVIYAAPVAPPLIYSEPVYVQQTVRTRGFVYRVGPLGRRVWRVRVW